MNTDDGLLLMITAVHMYSWLGVEQPGRADSLTKQSYNLESILSILILCVCKLDMSVHISVSSDAN